VPVPDPRLPLILIVAGVAGSGKTTVGLLLAAELGWEFADGDAFHPEANLAKMQAGKALSDEDRKPWLRAICQWMDERVAAAAPAVIACSALKRSYREQLLDGRPAKLAFLAIGEHDDESRLQSRAGHFFPESLVTSQFAILEPPTPDEPNVLVVPSGRTPKQTASEIIRQLGLPV
jgi:gluconokinase